MTLKKRGKDARKSYTDQMINKLLSALSGQMELYSTMEPRSAKDDEDYIEVHRAIVAQREHAWMMPSFLLNVFSMYQVNILY